MAAHGGARRLAAILAADMVGYSRLMEADESGTLARLKTHRLELVDPAIAKNKGRIIKTTGDGMLVEFQSVADAVAVRRRDPAPDGAAQRGRVAGAVDPVPDRHQPRRRDRRGRRHLRRRRERRRAPPGAGRAGRHLRLRGGARPGRRPSRRRIRGPGRAERQEHRAADPRLPGAARAGAARPRVGRRTDEPSRGDASRRSSCCRSST